MFERIIVMLIICLLLLTGVAMADAAGDLLDEEHKLLISVIPQSNEAEIDGVITAKITLTNNSSDNIDIRQIYIFGHEVGKNAQFDPKIRPGKKVTLEVSVKIDHNVNWYKKDSQYFTNLDVNILFIAKDDELDYWEHTNLPIEPIPIRLANVKDGTKLIKLNINEKEDTLYFCDQFYGEGSNLRGCYHGDIANDIEVKNISTNSLNNFYFCGTYGKSNKETLDINQTLRVEDAKTSFYIEPDEIPKELPVYYRVIFQNEGDYYAVEEVKTYPTKILPILKLDVTAKRCENGFKVSVKNLSDKDIENLFIHFMDPYRFDYDNYIPIYVIDAIKVDECVEIIVDDAISLIEDWNFLYVAGYYIGDYIYPREYWKSEDGDIHSDNYAFEAHRIKVVKQVVVSPSPKPTPNPTPKRTPGEIVIPPSKGTPYPTPEPSEQPVVVEHVTTESIVPYWVWMALIVAIVGTGILVLAIWRKHTKNIDKRS